MRRGRAAAKRRNRNIIFSVILVTFVAAVTGGAGYLYFNRSEGLGARQCPVAGPSGQVVLLVDKTDPLTFTQKQAFQTLLDSLVSRELPPGYLLTVFALGGDFKSSAEPVFNECNPGSGANASVLTSNPEHLKKRFEERFRKPMLHLADELQTTQPARISPVLEMLQMTAINGFRKENVNGPRRLIIVSDMLHNTSDYTMYQGTLDFSRFHDSDYGRRMSTNFGRVDVELQYLLTTPRLQTRRQLKFWEDYFAASGGRIVSVRPVEG
ncbi:hypothetical protein AWB81_05844 [Caballeronia arationis]|uniref:hypothetical protein n=1 Tax=Caballeronia arationis TaxID=1777142 RepID=UPI00074BCE10|nr:hypothetical protein [Caballeronia arationis]SAL00123.1 hypothetical protein AWB81_05844 [Caballeronia arationis]